MLVCILGHPEYYCLNIEKEKNNQEHLAAEELIVDSYINITMEYNKGLENMIRQGTDKGSYKHGSKILRNF